MVTGQFQDRPNRQGRTMIAVQVVLILLATLAVTLRIVSRYVRRRLLRVDDYLIVTGFLFGLGVCAYALFALGIENFDSDWYWNFTEEDYHSFGERLFALNYPCVVSVLLIRVSILIFYIRHFGHLRAFKILLYTIGVSTLGWAVSFGLVISLRCGPLHENWNSLVNGICHDTTALEYFSPAFNVSANVVLLVLVVPSVQKLRKTKIQLCVLLVIVTLWLFICVIGFSNIVIKINREREGGSTPLWYEGLITLSMSAEPNLSIICACIPTIKLSFRRSAPKGKSPEDETSINQPYFQQKPELGSEDRAVEMPPETRAHGAYELSADQEIHEMPMTVRHEAP